MSGVAALRTVEAHAEHGAVVLDGETLGRFGVVLHARSSAAKRSTSASRVSWHVVAPPGGSGSRTGPCSRLGSRIVAWPGRRGLAPLVLAPDLEVDGRPVAVDEVLARDAAAHPVGVADVVELAELAVELPEPRVVAHPVGAEVDQPRLAHAAVVVASSGCPPGAPTRDPSARAAARRGRSGRRDGRSAGTRWRCS